MAQIPEVVATLNKLLSLHSKKNNDYSGDRGPMYNFEFCDWLANQFKKIRDKTMAVFVGVKIARLAVLLSSDGEPNNESIEDSFDDAILYMTIWKARYMRDKEQQRMSDVKKDMANTV